MSSDQYTLYDIASRPPCSTWTPNPWKTRLVFNFKRIDFGTRWLHYPEIKPELENQYVQGEKRFFLQGPQYTSTYKLLSVQPNESGPFPYTIPTIITPDGKYVMDSRAITEYVESKHPEPSLHLDSAIVGQVESLWGQYMRSIVPIFLNQVPKRILADESLDYWYTTRKEFTGMSVEELEEAKGGEKAWNEAEPILRETTALLKQTEGPFFLGGTVSYADLVWASVLLFSERIGPDFFEEALKRSGDKQAHLDLLNAVRPWSL